MKHKDQELSPVSMSRDDGTSPGSCQPFGWWQDRKSMHPAPILVTRHDAGGWQRPDPSADLLHSLRPLTCDRSPCTQHLQSRPGGFQLQSTKELSGSFSILKRWACYTQILFSLPLSCYSTGADIIRSRVPLHSSPCSFF